MALRIKYTSECGCGGTMDSTTLDLTQEPGEEVVIDLDMFGGFTIQCNQCLASTFVPDLADFMQEVD